MTPTTTPPADATDDATPWSDLAPLLDAAVHALPARDRDALLLRYFQGHSIRDVATALSVSEDAAKQRLSRAVEKLRRTFAARGLTTPATALTATLLAHTSTHAAPPTLISAACGFALPATTVPASISLIAGKTLLMTQLKSLAALVAVTTTTLIAAAGAALLLAAPPPPKNAPASPLASAAAPATAPTTAAGLVREFRAAESWIDTVKTFQLTAEFIWLPPAPGVPPAAAANFTEGPEKITLGFDDHRLFYRADAVNYLLVDRRTWDGKLAVIHEKYSPKENNQEHYSLQADPSAVGGSVMSDLSWFRAGPRKYWWVKAGSLITNADFFGGEPEDFHLAGRETFRGGDCHVLESDLYYRRLYVGVADRHLYGLTQGVLPRRSSVNRDAINRQIARDMGATVTTRAQFDVWLKSLPPADQRRYRVESFRRTRSAARPQTTFWYADYKEVAPGRWLPMHQGYDVWSDPESPGEPFVRRTRDTRITSVTIDQPLPDAAFAWDFTEGVDVFDLRHDPPLQYKYKRHFEPAEWAAILDDAAQRKARFRPGGDSIEAQLRRPSPLGKPAPEFPEGATWINSAPLRLADLKGKTVIVEFFASASKFSRPDVAQLNDLHARRDRPDGATVIAVHPAGTPVEQVRQWVKDNGVTYPVCIDTPAGPTPWDGTLFTSYHPTVLPNVYLLNPRGVVRFEGTLDGAVQVSRESAPRVPDGL